MMSKKDRIIGSGLTIAFLSLLGVSATSFVRNSYSAAVARDKLMTSVDDPNDVVSLALVKSLSPTDLTRINGLMDEFERKYKDKIDIKQCSKEGAEGDTYGNIRLRGCASGESENAPAATVYERYENIYVAVEGYALDAGRPGNNYKIQGIEQEVAADFKKLSVDILNVRTSVSLSELGRRVMPELAGKDPRTFAIRLQRLSA